MEFSDKLNYLLELTHTEGKSLAAAMNVTPPQISKMRRGNRGLPKDKNAARNLARFFAQRCGSDFQKDALSQTLRIAQIRNVDKESMLTDIILDWLSDEQDPNEYAAQKAGEFFQKLEDISEEQPPAEPEDDEPRSVLTAGDSNFFVYYGNDGRRWAVQTFMHYLIQQRRRFTVNILSDENVGWSAEDPAFSEQLQTSIRRLTEQGCIFRRIASPIMNMDQAFDSLIQWFPLHLTGKATSYYYKRMRDNLNRVTIYSVPDVAVMFSFSVAESTTCGATFFTIDKKTVNAITQQFENYLALCEPILSAFSADDSFSQMMECTLDFENCKGSCLQRSNRLSFITLPWDVAMTLEIDGDPGRKSEFLTSFAQRYKKFKQNLQQYQFTDIIRLAPLQEILAGRVLIPSSPLVSKKEQFYTPATYSQHLHSILYLLEHQEHYHVVLRDVTDTDPTMIYVKEGFRALIAREVYPFTVFEVSERYLVDAFAEYLRRMMPADQTEITNKRLVVTRIKDLLSQLDKAIAETPQE